MQICPFRAKPGLRLRDSDSETHLYRRPLWQGMIWGLGCDQTSHQPVCEHRILVHLTEFEYSKPPRVSSVSARVKVLRDQVDVFSAPVNVKTGADSKSFFRQLLFYSYKYLQNRWFSQNCFFLSRVDCILNRNSKVSFRVECSRPVRLCFSKGNPMVETQTLHFRLEVQYSESFILVWRSKSLVFQSSLLVWRPNILSP